jgi:AmpE protein
MIFLVLLLTVGVYKVQGWHFNSKHDKWFYWLGDKIMPGLAGVPRLAMLITLIVPLVIAALFLNVARDWLFGFAAVLLHVFILFYAFGRVNLFEQLEDYLRHWSSGDFQSAYHHAEKQFNSELDFVAGDSASLHVSCCKGLLYQWFEQVFVIVFWYLVAGPLAALFMRLLSLYERRYKSSGNGGALQLLHVLEWLPVRLLALTYAIAGNFSHCFKTLMASIVDYKMPTNELLLKAGLAAAGLDEAEVAAVAAHRQAEQLKTLQRLQVRSLVVCMVLVALLTIF